jgi:hypothetical protein
MLPVNDFESAAEGAWIFHCDRITGDKWNVNGPVVSMEYPAATTTGAAYLPVKSIGAKSVRF